MALAALLLVAATLRPAITAVGPVIGQIGRELELDSTRLGLLASLPLLAFSAMSLMVARSTRRFGIDRVILAALLLMALGLVVRVIPSPGAIWVGTVSLAVAVAVGNVLVPAVVKRDYSATLAVTTGWYTVALTASAAVASGVSYPLAQVSEATWRLSLGIWVVLPLTAAVAWQLRRRGQARVALLRDVGVVPPEPGRGRVWTSSLAWTVTGFMGLQSLNFHLLVTWLPSMEVAGGVTPSGAGWHLFLMQIAGMGGGLLASRALAWTTDQRLAGVLLTSPMLLALPGLALVPSLALVWVLLMGLSTGACFVLALSLFGLRSSTTAGTVQLSGMAQAVGYLMAATGPVMAGWLHDTSGSWQPALVAMTGVAILQCLVVVLAGKSELWDSPIVRRPD